MDAHLPELEYVTTMLVNRLLPPDRRVTRQRLRDCPPKGRVVFLLGAGCSCQYGLPSFRDLLTYIWEDCFHSLPDPSWSFEMLRDELDRYWQSQGPRDRKQVLWYYLSRVKGRNCPGYLRLACLARDGYVKAIVNMNFDILLEQSLQEVGQPYKVTSSFRDFDPDCLMVYKPHGTIGRLHEFNDLSRRKENQSRARSRNELILDIANSELFSDPEEQKLAQELLAESHVVTMGYSGVDAKIAAALRGYSTGSNPRNKKLFVVNVSRPDPRLLLVMAERSSQDLSVVGEEASFENFMEYLTSALARARAGASVFADGMPRRRENINFMTRDERDALNNCLRLALGIRASINVADRSTVSIEEHGKEIYNICVRLASNAGVCLTSPEKYLLHCAAYLHDLGYFAAYSRNSAVAGLKLLLTHGAGTEALLKQRLADEPSLEKAIVPKSYEVSLRGDFVEMLFGLCRYHTVLNYTIPIRLRGAVIKISGTPVPVRMDLLHALFSSGEHIVNEHPFLPSTDLVIAKDESLYSVDDPVLDLYLRRKKDEIDFALGRGKIHAVITGHGRGGAISRKAVWLLTLAAQFFVRLDTATMLHGGWGIRFHHDLQEPFHVSRGKNFLLALDLLAAALEEELREAVGLFLRESQREIASTLALVSKSMANTVKLLRPKASQIELGVVNPEDTRGVISLILDIVERWVRDVARFLENGDGSDVRVSLGAAIRWTEEIEKKSSGPLQTKLRQLKAALSECQSQLGMGRQMAAATDALVILDGATKVVGWVMHTYRDDLLSIRSNSGSAFEELLQVPVWLKQATTRFSKWTPGEIASILDLVAIYTLKIGKKEPRVSLCDEFVGRLLAAIREPYRVPHQCLLYQYLPRRRQSLLKVPDADCAMDRVFFRAFEEILFPAWRFFARNWHDQSETVLMARICLDLGSSRFRSEVVGGLRYLLSEKVFWRRRSTSRDSDVAFGHDECTLCTARLLYIFSYARRLFPDHDLKKFTSKVTGRSLHETVGGILRYLIARGPEANSWWGVGRESNERGVRSPDYLAWAARAVAFCLTVDNEIRDRSGESWLGGACGVELRKVQELLGQRWQDLFSLSSELLLSGRAEEPQSYTLGRVALAYLDLLRLDRRVSELVLPDPNGRVDFVRRLCGAMDKISHPHLAQMSRYYVMPVMIVQDGILTDEMELKSSARTLAQLCRTCVDSRIWIREGVDAGSWGGNVKNTQGIVTSLAAFWHHAFSGPHHKRFKQAFEETED